MANGRSEGYGVAVGAHHPGYHILHGVVVARWVIVSEPSHYQPGKIGERAVEPEVIEYAFHLIYRLGYVLDEEDIAWLYYVKGGGYESGYDGKVASGEDGCGCAAAVVGIAWKPHILMLSAEYREQPPGIVVAT